MERHQGVKANAEEQKKKRKLSNREKTMRKKTKIAERKKKVASGVLNRANSTGAFF
jgi:hypothetical protein